MSVARTPSPSSGQVPSGERPVRTSTWIVVPVTAVLGALAGAVLWLVNAYVNKYGPEGAGWSLRGNGSLIVLFGGFLLLLVMGWATLAVWQLRRSLSTSVLIAGLLLPACIIVGASATGAAVSSWLASHDMARGGHTATLLADGRVLVMGGSGESGTLNTALVYDTATAIWSPAASMPGPDTGHTATLLPSGRVLVAGGWSAGTSAYLYNPHANTWSSTGGMHRARDGLAAVVLRTGKVLVAGGAGTGPDNLATAAEVYDPQTGKWALTSPMLLAVTSVHAALLGNGNALAIGTYPSPNYGPLLVGAQVYDPAANRWIVAADAPGMNDALALLPLPDGRAVAVGLSSSRGGRSTVASIYDPAARAWSAPRAVRSGRYDFTATVLRDGRVLVAGGSVVLPGAHHSEGVTTAQLFDPQTGVWSTTGSMREARTGHTLTLLRSGKVLAAGGNGAGYLGPGALTAELYDPRMGTWQKLRGFP